MSVERKKGWEVHPIPMREIEDVEQMPENTDAQTIVKRVKARQLQRLSDEADELELRTVVEERREGLRNVKARKEAESEQDEGEEEPAVTIDEAKAIAELPLDKRQEVVQTYAMLNATRQKGAMGGLLPLILYAKTNPQGSPSDMMTFANALIDGVKKLSDLKAGSEGVSSTDTAETVKAVLEHVAGKEKGTNMWEQVMTDEKTYNRMKDLFGGPKVAATTADPNESKRLDIEIAKINSNLQIQLARLGLDKERNQMVSTGVSKLFKVAGTAFAEGEEEGEEEGEAEPVRRAEAPAKAPRADELTLRAFPCQNCNATISVPNPEKARQIKCAKCGSVYDYAP